MIDIVFPKGNEKEFIEIAEKLGYTELIFVYEHKFPDVKDKFKKSNDKIEWIKEYIHELHTTFSNIKLFETDDDLNIERLKQLDIPAYAYPFIIKGYKYLDNKSIELTNLFNILEIIIFRAKLINSRANIQERLNLILQEFTGSIEDLLEKIQTKLNESWYWSDDNTKNYLNGSMYGNKMLHSILWEYENFIQNKGYNIKNIAIENEQIEHISPQTPTNGENIESGYDVNEDNQYAEEFKGKYLNSIGNLMLISGSHNSSIGNKPFKDKVESYDKNPLLNQQAEIKDFAKHEEDKIVWKKESINTRQVQIVDFSLNFWNFKKIKKEAQQDQST